MSSKQRAFIAGITGLALISLAGCAAGPDSSFGPQNPAGFFAGLWHGFIAWITFIISLFSSVKIYEVDNVGALYDLGFLIGMALWLGGGASSWGKHQRKSRREREWEEVARKVEQKIKREMRKWAEASDEGDWDEVERKVEEKIKRKLRDWADS